MAWGWALPNRVRRGPIGLVGASGTGLQLVTARIHQLGGGITHALGCGGRDLSEPVGAITALQALDLLRHDPATRLIVLISSPAGHPRRRATAPGAAHATGKPVVVNFIGYRPADEPPGDVYFARTLDAAAELAVELAGIEDEPLAPGAPPTAETAPGQHWLRGVFSGGTLAYEAQLLLREYLPAVYSNAPLNKAYLLPKATESREHTVVDLGEDEFTVGRLHPMLDDDLRIKRILQEASDPAVAVLLLDVVLGDGTHRNPAGELAPALAQAQALAAAGGRQLEIIAIVVGTDDDPQNLAGQAATGRRRRTRRIQQRERRAPRGTAAAARNRSAACRLSTWRRWTPPSAPSTSAWNPLPPASPARAPASYTWSGGHRRAAMKS